MNALSQTMSEATNLTRAGRLMDATALIQERLRRPNHMPESKEGRGSAGLATLAAERLIAPVLAAPKTGVHGAAPQTSWWTAQRTGKAVAAPTARGTTLVPDGASFDTRTVRNAAGALGYKLYTPSTYTKGPSPLVVMLHGCTQSPDDFAIGTRMNEWAERYGFFVAYPEQTRAANSLRCWNWFKSGDQSRDRGEPSLIADATRRIMADYPVDPKRVYVAGLSAGGAAAAIMGCAYPDLYAGVGVHSGLACGAASDMPTAFAAMRGVKSAGHRVTTVPTIVFHGLADTTVNPSNAHAVADQVGTTTPLKQRRHGATNGATFTHTVQRGADDRIVLEQWMIDGAGHAWSGGNPAGSYAAASGPDASREMLRFFGIVSDDDGVR